MFACLLLGGMGLTIGLLDVFVVHADAIPAQGSPNTAETHAVSIYRKLNAGTRGQAVARAQELGLLEG